MKNIWLISIVLILLNKMICFSWDSQFNFDSTFYKDQIPDISLSTVISKQVTFNGFQDHQIDYEVISEIKSSFFNHHNWKFSDVSFKNYRSVFRYYSHQFEIRIGRQQINFGRAKFLRPLQWFDTIDPLDPTRHIQGVYGVLGRYFFLDNQMFWLWSLYKNEDVRIGDFFSTKNDTIELGGRYETPVSFGDVGLSFHHRQVDNMDNFGKESRFGLDMLFNSAIPIWTEHVMIFSNENSLDYSNYSMVVGSDYTVDIGNGVYIMSEYMLKSSHVQSIKSDHQFLTVQLSYPLSIFNSVSFISMMDDHDLSEQVISLETTTDLYKMTLLLYKKMIKLSFMIDI